MIEDVILGSFIRNITGSEYVLSTPLLLRSLLQAAGLPADETDIAKRFAKDPHRLEDVLARVVREAVEQEDVTEDRELTNES